MEVIAISNRKGGTGKTATVSCLGAGLMERGKKVLYVDMDSQRNLTSDFFDSENEINQLQYTTADIMRNKCKASQAIVHTPIGDIIPASKELSLMETELATELDKNFRLLEALKELTKTYHYVLIDCPPSLGLCTINALTACCSVIIPTEAEEASISGIYDLLNIVETVRKYTNEYIRVAGVLITRYKGRTQLQRQKAQEIRETMADQGIKVYEKPIRECITIAELRSIKRPVTNLYRYAGKGNNAREDYERLTDQVEEVAKMNYPSPYFDWRTEWNKRAEGLAKNWRKR